MEGVWKVLGGCQEVVCRVSGRYQEGVWEVSKGCLEGVWKGSVGFKTGQISKIILGPKCLGTDIFLDPIFSLSQNFAGPQIFGPKIFLESQIFSCHEQLKK